jgi:hypothetical protein
VEEPWKEKKKQRGVGGKVERDIKAGAVCVEGRVRTSHVGAVLHNTVEYTTEYSRTLSVCILLLCVTRAYTCDKFNPHIYCHLDSHGNDFTNRTSKWIWRRIYSTTFSLISVRFNYGNMSLIRLST